MANFFSLWVAILLLLISLLKLSQLQPLHPFNTPPPFFLSASLLADTSECSRSLLYFLRSSPEVKHFSMKAWFLLLGNGV